MTTPQLDKWIGAFGDEYTIRNLPTDETMAHRVSFWHNLLINPYLFNFRSERKTILELGAGVGANLAAIDIFYSYESGATKLLGLEPNKIARDILSKRGNVDVVEHSCADIKLADNSVDLVFTCGVLIHIPPEEISKVIDEIYRVTKKYIIICEYFAPDEELLEYRGEDNMLWRRDYGGLFIDRHRLISRAEGFAWKRSTGMDNLTWWILEKRDIKHAGQ